VVALSGETSRNGADLLIVISGRISMEDHGVSTRSWYQERVEPRFVGHKKPGRPSKGSRKQVKVRLPDALAAAFQQEAERRGISITDWIGQFASEQTGIPYQPQEALPLGA
jgi:hypothetical protein